MIDEFSQKRTEDVGNSEMVKFWHKENEKENSAVTFVHNLAHESWVMISVAKCQSKGYIDVYRCIYRIYIMDALEHESWTSRKCSKNIGLASSSSVLYKDRHQWCHIIHSVDSIVKSLLGRIIKVVSTLSFSYWYALRLIYKFAFWLDFNPQIC